MMREYGDAWAREYMGLARALKEAGGDPWADWCEGIAGFAEKHKEDAEGIKRLRELVPKAFDWIERNKRGE